MFVDNINLSRARNMYLCLRGATSVIYDGNATNNFATLVKRNKKQTVIDALNEFDPQIESIEALPDGLYLAMKGMHELLPNSLHYSTHKLMWNC